MLRRPQRRARKRWPVQPFRLLSRLLQLVWLGVLVQAACARLFLPRREGDTAARQYRAWLLCNPTVLGKGFRHFISAHQAEFTGFMVAEAHLERAEAEEERASLMNQGWFTDCAFSQKVGLPQATGDSCVGVQPGRRARGAPCC